MILIISHKEDYTTDYLINELNKRGVKYHRLNTEEIGEKHRITFSNKSTKYVAIDGYKEFSSVWFRRIKHPQYSFTSAQEEDFFQKDFRFFY